MQTELFDLPNPRSISEESAVARSSFLEKKFVTLRLDQTIGLTLALLVFYVLAFSWGVEKGKRHLRESQVITPASASVAFSAAPAATVAVPVKSPAAALRDEPVSLEVPITVEELPQPVAKVTRPEGQFTIQHVTYITQSAADREIRKLAQKGYNSFVIPSGKHLQVCIDGFQSRQDASKTLRQLRSQNLATSDAFVRPMVR